MIQKSYVLYTQRELIQFHVERKHQNETQSDAYQKIFHRREFQTIRIAKKMRFA